MSFSNNIRVMRRRMLMSQEDFAQAIGVSFTTVNRWESGKCFPSYKAMRQIDEYCRANGIVFDVGAEMDEASVIQHKSGEGLE